MKFCNKCGHRLDDDQKFCTKCGAPAPSMTKNSDVPPRNGIQQSPTTASVPMPSDTPQPQDTSSNTDATAAPETVPISTATTATTTSTNQVMGPEAAVMTTAAKANSKKRLIIIIAAIVAVILIVAGAGFGTYKAQLWGGKTVPSPTSLNITKSKKTHEFTAADVESSLHKRGFKTVTKPTFSAKPKGSFIDYNNIDQNKRYSANASNPITIISSNGPGVPKGTQNQPVQNVTTNLKSMGVTVHYYTVVVSDSGPKEGTVVASYPADGQPVNDTKTGIEVGVAKRGGGIGYDVLGMDKDKAKSQYASAGFNVTLKGRFSSKKMLGKIVDSNPKPGTEANGGDLTLYYGIDASGMKDAVSVDSVYGADSDWAQHSSPSDKNTAVGSAAPVAGTYCTKSGKCINLNEDDSGLPNGAPIITSSEDPEDTSSKSAKTNHSLLFCSAAQQPFCGPQKGMLYGNGTGAFELVPYNTAFGYKCGNKDEVSTGSGPNVCVNGNDSTDGISTGNLPAMTGASYDMGLLYAYFPVGSDAQKVVDSGYFDKTEVAKAKNQKAVDTSRPFFIRRDKSLYDKTSVSISDISDPNPFSPFSLVGKSAMEPVKPAPSDETAYYLVDQPQLDWDKLPEFTLSKSGKDKNAKAPQQQTKPAAKNATPDQITEAVGKGDFSMIEGRYCDTKNECIQLEKSGAMTYSGQPAAGLDHPNSQLHLVESGDWSDQARNHVPTSPYLNFNGPDSEYSCPGMTGKPCENYSPTADIIWPTDLIYVFKDADTSCFSSTDASATDCNPGFAQDDILGPEPPAPTNRPYLYPMNWKSNDTPSVNGVFYLQE